MLVLKLNHVSKRGPMWLMWPTQYWCGVILFVQSQDHSCSKIRILPKTIPYSVVCLQSYIVCCCNSEHRSSLGLNEKQLQQILTHWDIHIHICISELDHDWFTLWIFAHLPPSHCLKHCGLIFQLDPNKNISVQLYMKFKRQYIQKWHLQNNSHFVQPPMCHFFLLISNKLKQDDS